MGELSVVGDLVASESKEVVRSKANKKLGQSSQVVERSKKSGRDAAEGTHTEKKDSSGSDY